MAVDTITSTSSEPQFTGKGLLHGFLVGGLDHSNDPDIAIWDSAAASGRELVPEGRVDASQYGWSGAYVSVGKKFEIGVYVEISWAGSTGTVKVSCDIEG